MSDDDDKVVKNWKEIAESDIPEVPEAPEVPESALEHPSYTELEDKLTQAEMKAHSEWDKAVRAHAELENVRRRAQMDVTKAHKYALEKFATELLPVIDSLEQATQDSEDEGIKLTLQLLSDTLAKFSITVIDPVGTVFDPQLHEAMSMQASSDVPAGTVLTVFQKGYLLNERVIRPARVIVAKQA